MRIFMLGWEFPPFISGGLGTACYGLTRALNQLGHHIFFVLPQPVRSDFTTHVQIKTPHAGEMIGGDMSRQPGGLASYSIPGLDNVEFRPVPSSLNPYAQPSQTIQSTTTKGDAQEVTVATEGAMVGQPGHVVTPPPSSGPTSVLGLTNNAGPAPGHYEGDLFSEVHRYASIAVNMAMGEIFDVIHAHDWMTFPAGVAVAAATGKPLVVHVHSTEFDRSGEHVNQRVYDVERMGVHTAQKVIAVSHLTRNILISRYAAPPNKVEVVYNAIDMNGKSPVLPPAIRREEKIVLFLGRITMQKGPEYFLAAAKKVLEYEPDVRFVMAGSGDMIRFSIERAAELGIGHKVLFTGFLRGADVDRVFKMADLYVMPSVSEPFGIAPLEALSHDVPVLISKQSGVSEVLTHVLKVDFWDIDEMANKIIAVLRHPPLQATLREHGTFEVRKLTWKDSAESCLDVYQSAIDVYRGKHWPR